MTPNDKNPMKEENNLVTNGDFSLVKTPGNSPWTNSRAADSWNVYIDKNQTKNPTPTIEVRTDGKLCIDNSQDFRGAVTQKVKIDPNQKYEISFDIETLDKSGQAFLRILEEDPKTSPTSKHMWLSPMTSGTSSMHQLRKFYNPRLAAQEVTLELYYELGKGKVIFDNIHMTAVGPKDPDYSTPVAHKLEDQITIPLTKKYVFTMTQYHYNLEDPNYGSIDKGIFTPKQIGSTKVIVKDAANNTIKEIPLTILEASNDKWSPLLEQWVKETVGNQTYKPDSKNMQKLFNSLENKTKTAVESYNHEPNRQFLWDDLKNFKKSAQLTSSYRRLEDIAKQITNPHSSFYHNEKAVILVKDGIEWLHHNFYNPEKDIEEYANWWDYEIGVPRALCGSLALLRDYYTDQEILNYTNAIEHFVPDSNYFRKTLINPFPALGGNLVDMGRVKILSALLRKDDKLMEKTITSLNQLFQTVTSGNGFYKDGSYIDHTNLAYTGAYGSVLIDGISQLLPIIQKTAYAISSDKVDLIYSWVDHSFLPLIIKGQLVDMSRGRSISRENMTSQAAAIEVFRGLLRLSNMSNDSRNLELKAKIKSLLKSDSTYNIYQGCSTYKDMADIESLLADTSIAEVAPKTYLASFNDMDKLVYFNATHDFGFALSMHSDRTQNYEAMNDENTRGWYTGDGMFYLYNNDLKHYNENYWPTVNPYKLPGTTENDSLREDATQELCKKYRNSKEDDKVKTGQVTNTSDFVGSVKLSEEFAAAAMTFSNWDRSLSAKKSWSIFDDKIVFLGTDVQNSSQTANTITTIEQRRIDPNNPYTLYINGQKVDLSNDQPQHFINVKSIFLESENKANNIAYLFFKEETLDIQKQVQSGSWYDINKTASNKNTVSNGFITISKTHTTDNRDYAYMLIPNKDREAFDQLSQNNSIQLIENSKDMQVSYDQVHKIWSIIKYDNLERKVSDQFTVKDPGLYMIEENQDHYRTVYYQPSRKENGQELTNQITV